MQTNKIFWTFSFEKCLIKFYWNPLRDSRVLKISSFPETYSASCQISIVERFTKTVNPFVPSAPFLYPLKRLENRKVFSCSQGVEKGCLGNKWINKRFSAKSFIINVGQCPEYVYLPPLSHWLKHCSYINTFESIHASLTSNYIISKS